MQENQNAFQNAGTNGYSYYQSNNNQTSVFLVLILVFVLLLALLQSEERYRRLVESRYLEIDDRRKIIV